MPLRLVLPFSSAADSAVIVSHHAGADFDLTADPNSKSWKGVRGVFADKGPRGEAGPGPSHRDPLALDRRQSLFPLHLPVRNAASEARSRDRRRDQPSLGLGRGRGLHRLRLPAHPPLQGVRSLAAGRMGGPGHRPRFRAGRRRHQVELRLRRQGAHRCREENLVRRRCSIPFATIDKRKPAAGVEYRINLYRCQGADAGPEVHRLAAHRRSRPFTCRRRSAG